MYFKGVWRWTVNGYIQESSWLNGLYSSGFLGNFDIWPSEMPLLCLGLYCDDSSPVNHFYESFTR